MLEEWEIEHLEDVTQRLQGMCVEAAHHLATGTFGTLGLSERALAVARDSLAADPVSVYGRFDLRYDGEGPAQLYEYNADTPTGLIESSVAQWYWLQDLHPERDQWNSLHERLVAAWRRNARRIGPVLHLAHSRGGGLRRGVDDRGLPARHRRPGRAEHRRHDDGADRLRPRPAPLRRPRGPGHRDLLQALPVGGDVRRRVRRPGPRRPWTRPAGSSRSGRCCCRTRRCWPRCGTSTPGTRTCCRRTWTGPGGWTPGSPSRCTAGRATA